MRDKGMSVFESQCAFECALHGKHAAMALSPSFKTARVCVLCVLSDLPSSCLFLRESQRRQSVVVKHPRRCRRLC